MASRASSGPVATCRLGVAFDIKVAGLAGFGTSGNYFEQAGVQVVLSTGMAFTDGNL